MQSMLGELRDYGGDAAMLSEFIVAKRNRGGNSGWEVHVSCGASNTDEVRFHCLSIINSAGLLAEHVAQQLQKEKAEQKDRLIQKVGYSLGRVRLFRSSNLT